MVSSALVISRSWTHPRTILSFLVNALECYVCHNQDGNTDKCLRTIRTCEHEHDRCLSIIRWSTTPYWSQVQYPLRFHEFFNDLDYFRELKNNITSPRGAPPRPSAIVKSRATCLYAITFGTKIGSVLNAVKAIGVTIT